MPRIAAGLGGLEWSDVMDLALDILDPLPIPILIYSDYEPGVMADEWDFLR